jgi:hypothetical protein
MGCQGQTKMDEGKKKSLFAKMFRKKKASKKRAG